MHSRESQPQPLDYARPDAEQPPLTSISIHRDADRVTFIDPPMPFHQALRRIVPRAIPEIAIPLVLAVASYFIWRHGSRFPVLFFAFLFVATLWDVVRRWTLASRYPTVIQIASGMLSIQSPGRKPMAIPIEEVLDVNARRPRRLPGVPGRSSSLIIVARESRLRLLPCRDYIEVRWLAQLIRQAIGKPVNISIEPEVGGSADHQNADDLPPLWSGNTPVIANARLPRTSTLKKFTKWFDREYNELGCLTVTLLITLVVVGLITVARTSDAVVICLQFGTDAYLHHGLRPVPHRGFFKLNNGQEVAGYLQSVFWILCFTLLPLWIIGSALLAIGLNQFIRPIYQRRLKTKMDRLWKEKQQSKIP